MAKEENEMKEEGKKDIEDILAEPEKDDLDIEEAVAESDEPIKEEAPDIEPEKEEGEEAPDEDPKEDKDVLEKAVEEKDVPKEEPEEIVEPVGGKKVKGGKKNWWKISLLVFLGILLVTAIVLGVMYYFSLKNQKKTEAPATTDDTTTQDTPQEEVTEKLADTSVYVSTTDGLRLRKEPSPTAEILDTMPFGTKLTPLDKSGDWIKVTYNSKTGWCMAAYTSAENPLVYKNTTYGFQITFPQTWATYKLIPSKAETGETAGYYVALTTTDTTYIDSSGEKGYDSLFAISIYTKAQWTAVQAEEGPKPTLAVQNDKYVIGYSLPNGIPAKDVEARTAETKSVIATIKFY